MNKQELIEKINEISTETPFLTKILDHSETIELIEQLDEPKPIKLKDVISRIKDLDKDSRLFWLDEILNELGSDYGLWKYKAGFEQGKLDGYMEREKPVVPQVVIDYYEFYRGKLTNFEEWFAKFEVESDEDFQQMDEVGKWLYDVDYKTQTQRELALAMLIVNGLDAVEVEKEKRYRVKMKNAYYNKYPQFLCETDNGIFWAAEIDLRKTKFTRKELEEAGFGEVFNSPLFEVEEVE